MLHAMVRSRLTLLVLAFLTLSLGCSAPRPPANWPGGGAWVVTPAARWVRGGSVVDLTEDGRVLVDGDHELNIDAAGRVFEPDGTAVALLEEDGRLVGPDEAELGTVGALTAARPGEQTAWLGLEPSGEVRLFGRRGERRSFGVWIGCGPTPQHSQACMLVTHLLAQRIEQAGPTPHVVFGFGVGVGF
jgi:hypothetical protein